MTTPMTDAPRVLALSARDGRALAEARHRLADHLEREGALDPDDVAATLHLGRERFAARHAAVGRTTAELAAALRAETPAETPSATPGTAPAVELHLGALAEAAAPELPQVTEALALADSLGAGPAGRAVALQYGLAAWLIARGVVPREIHGTGTGALAADALLGRTALADALRAQPPAVEAPDRTPLTVELTDPVTGATERLPLGDGAHLLAHLWRSGLDVDTTLGRPGRRVRLPGYPFRRSADGPTSSAARGLRPLTPHEQRWLFHDLVRSSSSAEHNTRASAVRPGPAPRPSTVAEAFSTLQQRHPELRTAFTQQGGRWFARTAPTPAAVTAPDPSRTAEAVAAAPFELRDAPLVRCVLDPAPDGSWTLALAAYEPVAGPEAVEALLTELLDLCGAPTPVAA
ncbi:hypothetical protein [Streptomyces sp. NRRL WC-3742]|uniref:CurL C-terminal domain-containing protein n=1 Tax=Streptomyces sp. NRRL WC-3742 TaxID=1463934 RepID=UPI0004CC3BEF|nr:hypothetical protein [Streptomyces sp. NRRL WC-3742]